MEYQNHISMIYNILAFIILIDCRKNLLLILILISWRKYYVETTLHWFLFFSNLISCYLVLVKPVC